jgi:hypothetical protein
MTLSPCHCTIVNSLWCCRKAIAKSDFYLRRILQSVCPSVCLSVRMKGRDSHLTDSSENLQQEFSQNVLTH